MIRNFFKKTPVAGHSVNDAFFLNLILYRKSKCPFRSIVRNDCNFFQFEMIHRHRRLNFSKKSERSRPLARDPKCAKVPTYGTRWIRTDTHTHIVSVYTYIRIINGEARIAVIGARPCQAARYITSGLDDYYPPNCPNINHIKKVWLHTPKRRVDKGSSMLGVVIRVFRDWQVHGSVTNIFINGCTHVIARMGAQEILKHWKTYSYPFGLEKYDSTFKHTYK